MQGREIIRCVAGRVAAVRASSYPVSESMSTASVIRVIAQSPRMPSRPKLECWLVHNSNMWPDNLQEGSGIDEGASRVPDLPDANVAADFAQNTVLPIQH